MQTIETITYAFAALSTLWLWWALAPIAFRRPAG
jgi:hypothetical protein